MSMPRLTLTADCVAHAADYVLDHQETIRRAVCSTLGYSVDCCEIIGPAVMAAAHRIARGCNPEEHIGWIAAAVARDIDPPRHIAGEGTLEEAFALAGTGWLAPPHAIGA